MPPAHSLAQLPFDFVLWVGWGREWSSFSKEAGEGPHVCRLLLQQRGERDSQTQAILTKLKCAAGEAPSHLPLHLNAVTSREARPGEIAGDTVPAGFRVLLGTMRGLGALAQLQIEKLVGPPEGQLVSLSLAVTF